MRFTIRSTTDSCFAYGCFSLLLGIGLLLILFFRPDKNSMQLLERAYKDGKEAVGVVTYLEHNDGHNAEYHTVSYRFEVDGQSFEWSDDPGHDIYHRLGHGSQVPIIYLPEDPQRTSQIGPRERIKPKPPAPSVGWLLSGAAILFFLITYLTRHFRQ